MKNLKYLNEERSTVKDTTEQEVTRGYPHLEILHKMRSVANRHQCRRHYAQLMTSCDLVEVCRVPKHVECVVPKDVNIDGSIAHRSVIQFNHSPLSRI